MQRNLVTVKIWSPSEATSSPKSWLATGHAALQVFNPENSSQSYISFWNGFGCSSSYYDPENKDDPNYEKEGFQAICHKKEDHFHDEEKDDLIYKRPSDKEYHLNNLSPVAIQQEFDRRVQLGLSWSLKGSVLYLKHDEIANCSSLVYDLLVHAGFNNIVDPKTRVVMGTTQSAKNGFLVGSISALLFSWKILELAKNTHTVTYNMQLYKPGMHATIRSLGGPITFKSSIVPPTNKILKFIRNMYGWNYIAFAPHAKIKATSRTIAFMALFSSIMTATYFVSMKAAANHLTVKPTDFVNWLEKIKKSELSSQHLEADEVKQAPMEQADITAGYHAYRLFRNMRIEPSYLENKSHEEKDSNSEHSTQTVKHPFCTLL